MYNFTAIQTIAFAHNKKNLVKDSTIFEPGNPKMSPGLIQYVKSHIPNVVAATDPKNLWLEMGAKSFQSGNDWEKMNRKYDIVVSTSSFDTELDPWGHFKFLWDRTRTGGYIILDLPTSTASNPFSVNPNFVSYLRRYNDIDVPYMRLSDKTGQYSATPNSEQIYSTRRLNEDLLYKFKETLQLRLQVILKKNESEELKANGQSN